MLKKLSCRAMGMNCNFVAHDESEQEVVRKMGDHLKTAHRVAFTEEARTKAINLTRLEETG